MTKFQDGGQRRIDRLLAPGFLEEAKAASDDELLAHRDAATQEEADLSYVRRLLQGRLDILRFEQERRAGHDTAEPPLAEVHDDAELVRALTRVLAGGSSSSTPPAAAHAQVADPEPPSVGRRAAEVAATDVHMSDAGHLEQDELAPCIEKLAAFEAQVSGSRRQIQQVADALDAEVRRRVEAGLVPADRIESEA